jgi:hypothetical protein
MPRIVTTWAVFNRMPQYVFYFILRNSVLINMRFSGLRIVKVSNIHVTFYIARKLD